MASLWTVVFLLLLPCCFGSISFTLQEEEPIDTLIGNIATESELASNMTDDEFKSLKYDFLDQTKMASLFTINNDNGNIYTAVEIDRETECSFKEVCSLDFDVMVRSSVSTKYEIISVNIIILDVNDRSPTFQPNVITVQISESEAVGTTIGIDGASDSDSSAKNRIQNYTIVPVDGPFGLNVTKKDGGHILKLVLKRTLDRESINSYQVSIVAYDGGLHPNSGTLSVTVEVTDANDHSPVFTQSVYETKVKEGVQIGTSVLRVSATDDDEGKNAEIRYRFSSTQSDLDEIKKIFAINDTTGDISVVGNLVYEEGKVYEISIEATDLGQQPAESQCTVRITVEDFGNNPPTVRVNFLSSSSIGIVNVSESSKPGLVIAHVNVEDTDSGSNGVVTCDISDNSFALEAVQGKGYVVLIKSLLDRETKAIHNVTVTCEDQGTPKLMTSSHFLVHVQDENDHSPKFKQAIYFSAINENNAVGDFITQVLAIDDDFGPNALVRYQLSTDSHNMFAINPETGVITANTRFDRETNLFYKFTVIALDRGTPPKSSTASVVLNISDINDNPPVFEVPEFQFFVLENSDANTNIGSVSATDKDEGKNGDVVFKLSPTSNVPFIVQTDGGILTTKSLDREVSSKYSFQVWARDLGSPSLSSEITVNVLVRDQNDNAPFIVYPSKENNTMSISYLAPVGSKISSIKAYDLDEEGPNSQLEYLFHNGNELDIFYIGRNTGKISLRKTYHIDMDVTFAVSVLVKDKGDNPRHNITNFYIVLKYSNGTTVEALQDNGNKNIVISVIIVCFTILISAVIFTVICILCRQDKKLKKSYLQNTDKTLYDQKVPEVVMEVTPEINGVLCNPGDTPTKKKKKEVSFTLDEENHNMVPSFSNQDFNGRSHNQGPPVLEPDYDGAPTEFQNFPPNSPYLANNRPSVHKQRQPLPSTDNFSDSSGDTTTADSGRGGSDLDLSHIHRQDDKGSEYAKLQAPGSLNKVHLPHFDNFIQHTHGHLKPQPYSAMHQKNSNNTAGQWNPSYV
ncbi:protocadherin beta-9-like [Saccostrea echinata]|uniref:protocadherin beta-9-like n=1 Tax=Saccostrea echinata TaxID=191078 RepID=UPI002A804719|nr:protocadherin beta-9-like [Saccostrea echinata]